MRVQTVSSGSSAAPRCGLREAGISVRDAKLTLRCPRGDLELQPQTRGLFSASHALGSISLRRNRANACDGCAITTGRVGNLLFQRVRIEPVS